MSQAWQVLHVVVAYECAAVRLIELVMGLEVGKLRNARRSEGLYNRPGTMCCHFVYASPNFGVHGVGAE